MAEGAGERSDVSQQALCFTADARERTVLGSALNLLVEIAGLGLIGKDKGDVGLLRRKGAWIAKSSAEV
jgi:hypothetical protein